MEETTVWKRVWRAHVLVPFVMAIGLGMLLNDSYHAPPRPMLLPRSIQIGTLILCVILAIKNFIKLPVVPDSAKDPQKVKEMKKLIITFIGILSFPFWTYFLGFVVTSLILVFGVFMTWGREKKVWRHLIIGEALIVILVWGIMIWFFRFEYPQGLLFRALFP
jgi:hypothetical protein